jgi:hypothetical protein
MVKTIIITKHLSNQTKCLEVFLCYDFQNGIIDEEENLIFQTKPSLFFIGIISLPIVQ